MGYQSEIEIQLNNDSCYSENGMRIIDLIDKLIISGWRLDFNNYGKVSLLDKGNDFNFIVLDLSLTNKEIINLLKFKEIHKEFIMVNLHTPNTDKSIEVFFDYSKKYRIDISLIGEDYELKTTNPIKEIFNYFVLLYEPIFEWGDVKMIKFITGYDYEVIKIFEGKNILSQIEEEIRNIR